MEKKKLKTKYAKVKFKPGIVGNSIVTSPAIGEGFLAFDSQIENEKLHFSTDYKQQRLIGPILIPDIEILRKDNSTGEYYNLIFTKEDIQQINLKRQTTKLINKYNFEHDPELANFQNNEIIDEEIWIIKDSNADQTNFFGKTYPVGTLMSIVYIQDLDLFNHVVANYKGFSIEAYLDIFDSEEQFNKQKNNQKTIKIMEKNIFSFLNQKLFGKKEDTKQKFDLYAYMTADGKELIIDTATMTITIDGEVPADGDYTLEDGTVISVASGIITNIVDATTQPSDQTQNQTQPVDSTQTQPADQTQTSDSTSACISVEIEVELSKLKEEKTNFESEIEKLKSEITELNTQIDLYKKHQRALPKVEVINNSDEKIQSKNDLMINKLANLSKQLS